MLFLPTQLFYVPLPIKVVLNIVYNWSKTNRKSVLKTVLSFSSSISFSPASLKIRWKASSMLSTVSQSSIRIHSGKVAKGSSYHLNFDDQSFIFCGLSFLNASSWSSCKCGGSWGCPEPHHYHQHHQKNFHQHQRECVNLLIASISWLILQLKTFSHFHLVTYQVALKKRFVSTSIWIWRKWWGYSLNCFSWTEDETRNSRSYSASPRYAGLIGDTTL